MFTPDTAAQVLFVLGWHASADRKVRVNTGLATIEPELEGDVLSLIEELKAKHKDIKHFILKQADVVHTHDQSYSWALRDLEEAKKRLIAILGLEDLAREVAGVSQGTSASGQFVLKSCNAMYYRRCQFQPRP